MGQNRRALSIYVGSLLAPLMVGVPICLAENTRPEQYNHLDCWYDGEKDTIRCPPLAADVQTGRAAIEGADNEINRINIIRRKSAVRTSAKNPSCPRYRTYDAKTHTYRGYDGAVRKCQ